MVRFCLALVVGLSLVSAGHAARAADPLADCLRAPLADDLTAKVVFQDALRDLIAVQRPDLGALAALNRDLQVTLAKARTIRLDWLAAADPDRLRPLSADGTPWRSFAWEREDEAALRDVDARYTTVSIRADALTRRSDGHPDWPALRAHMRTTLSGDDRFRILVARGRDSAAATDAALRACFGQQIPADANQ